MLFLQLAANWLLAMYALFLLICWPRNAVSNVRARVLSCSCCTLCQRSCVSLCRPRCRRRLSHATFLWLAPGAMLYGSIYSKCVCVFMYVCLCMCVCVGACVNLWNMLAALCNFSPCIFTFLTVTSCGSLALYTRCCSSVSVCVCGIVWWFFYYYFYNFCWLFFCVLLMCLFNRKFTNTSALAL